MFGDLFSIMGEQTCISEISTKCDLYYYLGQSGEKKKDNNEKQSFFISAR